MALKEASKAKVRKKAVEEVSAGGIVYSKRRGVVRVVLLMTIHRKDGRKFVTWRLPKGHPAGKENLLQAARREVAEETGVLGTGGPKLGTAHFYFTHPVSKKFIHKYVHFYLFKKKAGSVTLHDKEYDTARWFTIPEAIKTATFKNDKIMIRRAAHEVKKRQARGRKRARAIESYDSDEETVGLVNPHHKPHD